MTVRFVSIGECMIELSPAGSNTLKLAYAGDTLNAAVYFARSAGADTTTHYMTALGPDPYSDAMIASWQSEGIDTSLVLRLPDALPGLYMIQENAANERVVHFWRSTSAATRLFQTDNLLDQMASFDIIYFTGVTLAILAPSQRLRFLEAVKNISATKHIAFNTNFRARLWPGADAARKFFETAFSLASFTMISNEDMTLLYGDETPSSTLERLTSLGSKEIVLTRGPESCFIKDSRGVIQVDPNPVQQVDATGAGDAFSGTYLAARASGKTCEEAAVLAHRVAATVVQHRGAITE